MSETVTLTRAAYEALIERIEDAEDIMAIAVARAREEALGRAAARADYLPMEQAKRILAGEHPLRVWRDHRGLTGPQLAAASGVGQGYISEIERGRKPGSLDAWAKLARALGLKIDDIAPQLAAEPDTIPVYRPRARD